MASRSCRNVRYRYWYRADVTEVSGTGYLCRTKATEVTGTDIDAVLKLPKFPVPVMQSVCFGTYCVCCCRSVLSYVCMYVCMYAYMYVCMYVCICVYMYVCDT